MADTSAVHETEPIIEAMFRGRRRWGHSMDMFEDLVYERGVQPVSNKDSPSIRMVCPRHNDRPMKTTDYEVGCGIDVFPDNTGLKKAEIIFADRLVELDKVLMLRCELHKAPGMGFRLFGGTGKARNVDRAVILVKGAPVWMLSKTLGISEMFLLQLHLWAINSTINTPGNNIYSKCILNTYSLTLNAY